MLTFCFKKGNLLLMFIQKKPGGVFTNFKNVTPETCKVYKIKYYFAVSVYALISSRIWEIEKHFV